MDERRHKPAAIVTIRLGEPLWRAAGERRLQLSLSSGSTVQDALDILVRRFPPLADALFREHRGRRVYQVFLNARHIPWQEAGRYDLRDGDVLHILPPAAGGTDYPPLPRAFYDRDTVQVARDLLGALLVRRYRGHLLVGRIVETEAYVGLDDTASHAAVGRTERNAVMFGPPGFAYVYVIYGMHHCLNVVTEREGFPAAVLIRALEPLQGREVMRALRAGRPDGELTNGPGKLCQALAIDLNLYGHDLTTGTRLWIAEGGLRPGEEVVSGPRVGVRGDRRALTVPWRFAVLGNPWVSRPVPWRTATRNRARNSG